MTNYKTLSEEIGDEVESQLIKTNYYRTKEISSRDFNKLIDKTKLDLRLDFSKIRQSPPSIEVIINTNELKDLAPTDKLTNLNLTIYEEGMEWVVSESEEGKIEEKLVSE